MECAAPSSFLVTLPLQAFSGYRFSRAPGSTVVPSHVSPANLAGTSNLDRRRWTADVGIASAISKPGACARRHVQAIRLRSLVVLTAGDKFLLCTRPPRPCAPSCWPTPRWPPEGACVMRDWPCTRKRASFLGTCTKPFV